MALVTLRIDGKRVRVDSGRTILEAAREAGRPEIPTLCHDERLEPFASCFLCVVKVAGSKTLVPSCATRVSEGMVVTTLDDEIRQARKAALELLLSNHYADCVGPCRSACPAGVDIQGYIALAALGKGTDAIRLIKRTNPLPSVCGRVCTRPCEVKGCRRGLLDEPVAIDFIKRYLADLDLGSGQAYRPEIAPPTGRRVAVVGAGPAGLSAAWYLALAGHAVEMFEDQPEPGGMLRYGIPAYRLPRDVLEQEIAQILSLGVTLHTNRTLGRDFTVAGLKRDGFDAVFLGIGAWGSSRMRVDGEDAPGVLSGIDFLKNFGLGTPVRVPGRVLVVGGGNTAVDCARTALRCGADEVRIVYRRTEAEMPANRTEIADAKEEGVRLDLLAAPVRVVTDGGRAVGLECQRMELGDPDSSGRRSPRPVPGSEFVLPCDFVLSAIGQSARVTELLKSGGPAFLPDGERLALSRWQTIDADERSGETSVEGVFSGGDVVTGAATAIEAIAAGRKAAHAIDAWLSTGVATPEPAEFFSRKDTFRKVTVRDLRSTAKVPRVVMPMLDADSRIKGFDEVERGLAPEQVLAEAHRCMECGCSALFSCDLRRYATEYGADVSRFLGEAQQWDVDRSHPLFELDPNKCILCGRCVRMCSEVVGISAFGFVNRGFGTVVKPALGGSLRDTDCVSCGLCADTCPTGAIASRVALAKPGPFPTEGVTSVCPACGVGCTLRYERQGETIVSVAGDPSNPGTLGLHCRRGRFGTAYVHAPDRLGPAPDAVGRAAAALRHALADGGEAAVFVSPRLTNEEVYLAARLAREALGGAHIASIGALARTDVLCPDVTSTATLEDVAAADIVLVVGSALPDEHFVADLAVKRAIRGGARLVYVHPEEDRAAKVAHAFVRCPTGAETEVVRALLDPALARTCGADPSDVTDAAAVLRGPGRKVVVCNRDFPGPRVPGDVRLYAAAADALGAGLLVLSAKANGQGVIDVLGDPTGGEALTAGLRSGRIRAALFLGEDPDACDDLPADLSASVRGILVRVVGDVVPTATTAAATVVLPLAAPAETDGTYTASDGRVQALSAVVSPAGGQATWQVIAALGRALGSDLGGPYASPADVLQAIRRDVPGYAKLAVPGHRDPYAGRRSQRFETSKSANRVDVPMLRVLDALENRFESWIAGCFGRTQKP